MDFKLLIIAIVFLSNVGLGYISQGSSQFDGTSPDRLPSYFSLNGTNGIRLPLDNRTGGLSTDYFIRLWVKLYLPSSSTQNQSSTNSTTNNQNLTLLEIPRVIKCFFNQNMTLLTCAQLTLNNTLGNNTLSINVSGILNQTWVQIAFGGSQRTNQSFIRIDYQDQVFKMVNGSFIPLNQTNSSSWNLFLGINPLQEGLRCDVRELIVANTFINQSQVANIKNQLINWHTNQLGNYRLQRGSLTDQFRLNLTGSLIFINQSGPASWGYDNIPNDICHPFQDYVLLPRLEPENNRANTTTIDSRISLTINNFQYTASFWIKPLSGQRTNSSFNASLAIFSLTGVFSLWFSDQQTLRVQFHSSRPINEFSSVGIFVPTNQWSNIQLIIDRTVGYEVRVYDLQRREIIRVNQSYAFNEQSPTGRFQLFNNFRGYIKSIMVYQARMNLPIDIPSGENATVNNSRLILYYKFDQTNIRNVRQLQSLAIDQRNLSGSVVNITGNITYDYQEWEDFINYTNTSTLGTLNQSRSLYDGLACQDRKLVYQIANTTSFIRTQLQDQGRQLTEATVEFWFKQPISQTNQTQYLFSLFSTKQSTEYFGIFRNANQSSITCQPINNQIQLQFASNLPNYQNWQHLACKFKSNFWLEGVYHNEDRAEKIFSQSLRNQNLILPQDTYMIIIGNRFNADSASLNSQFKEVRIWKEFRSNYLIKKFLYIQTNPSLDQNIIAYFRLNSEDPLIFGYPSVSSNTLVEQQNLTLVQQTGNNLICPLNSYSQSGTCFRNPFNKFNLYLLPFPLLDGTLQWKVTSKYQDLNSQYSPLNTTYTWTTPDFDLTSQQGRDEIVLSSLDNDSLNETKKIRLDVEGPIKSFYNEAEINLTINQCAFIYEASSYQSVFRNLMTKKQGQEDFIFQLKEQRPKNCPNYLVSNQLNVQVLPSNLGIQNVTVSYNDQTSIFDITLPKEEQLKIPNDQEIQIIVTASWQMLNDPLNMNGTLRNLQSEDSNLQPEETQEVNKTEGNDNSTQFQEIINYPPSSMSVIYIIKYAREITPIISANLNTLMIGDNLTLDASQSFFGNQDTPTTQRDQSGISYYWDCPLIFQSICSSNQRQQSLSISYQQFLDLKGSYSQNYTFTLIAWNSLDETQADNFATSITISYVQVALPQFSINIQNNTRPLASRDTSFILNFNNYDINDQNLQIQWYISPSIDPSYFSFQNYQTNLTFKKGGLQFSTQYTITVTVNNKLYQDRTKTTQVYSFSTGSGPKNGEVSIAPVQGTALNTVFNFTIFNWESDKLPIKYRITGKSNMVTDILDITDRYYYQNESLLTILPLIQQVFIEISDDSDEFQIIQRDFNVNLNQSMNISEVVKSAIASLQSDTTYNNSYILVFAAHLASNPNNATIQDQLEAKTIILNYLDNLSSSFTVLQNDLSNTSLSQVSIFTQILELLTQDQQSTNDTIILKSYKIMQQLKTKSQAISAKLMDSGFRQNYGDVLSNMLIYSQSRIQALQQQKRNLQTIGSISKISDLNGFIIQLKREKDFFAQKICEVINSTSYEKQLALSTQGFNLIQEKVPINSFVYNRSYISTNDQSLLTIPINLLLDKEQELMQDQVSNVCIFSTFYSVNLLQGYNFANQSMIARKQPLIMEVSSIDNQGLKVINDVGIQLLSPLNNSNQSNSSNGAVVFTAQFTYDFNNTNNEFLNNQTICMSIESDQLDYTNKTWSSQYCQTEYKVTQKQIVCRCTKLGSFYYAIVNDYTRTLYKDPDSNSQEEGFLDRLWEMILSFNSAVVAVIIFLLIYMLIMPILAVCLDKRDYSNLKNDKYEVKDELIRKISLRKKLPFEVVLYKKKQYQPFLNIRELSFCQVYRILLSNLHPLFGLFTKFDVELKRLVRQMIVGYQICLLVIVVTLRFGIGEIINDKDFVERDFNDEDISYTILVGVLITVLTLPVHHRLIDIIKTKLVQEQAADKSPRGGSEFSNPTKQRVKNKYKLSPDNQVSQENGVDDFDNLQDLEDGKEPKSNQRFKNGEIVKDRSFMKDDHSMTQLETINIDEPVMVVDKCVPCKLIFLLLFFFFVVGTCIFIGVMSSKNPSVNSQQMVASFFIAFILGYFGLNILRIVFISIFAIRIVKAELGDQNLGCFLSAVNCLIVPEEAKEIINDIILISELQNNDDHLPIVQKKPTNQKDLEKQPQNNQSPGMKHKINDDSSPSQVKSNIDTSSKRNNRKMRFNSNSQSMSNEHFDYDQRIEEELNQIPKWNKNGAQNQI